MEASLSLKVAEIEQQLRDIWKGFSQKDQKAVTRAQVMNLIVYTSDKEAETEISRVLADVAADSPGRMIVLIQDADLPVSALNAWVNALCHPSSGGRKQVCCEQIMIHAGDRDPFQWSSIVLPLIVPDVPVFLWWRDHPDEDVPLLNSVLEVCDRLILDSASSNNFKTIIDVMNAHGEWLAISDLNWAKMTPWRHAIANFYDHLTCGSRLEEIEQIKIEFESPFERAGQAYLLLGWLASSLKWNWTGVTDFRTAAGNPIHVEIIHRSNPLDRLLNVNLLSQNAEFKVSLSEDSLYLRTEVTLHQQQRGVQLVNIPSRSLSVLLGKELSILGHDSVYERTIRSIMLRPDLT
jgi:glucose-6-phosphate dehydrogenase assembly protein OpcA